MQLGNAGHRARDLHDLCSALLAAVGHAINLATRNEDAHFHERSASGVCCTQGTASLNAQGARLGFL